MMRFVTVAALTCASVLPAQAQIPHRSDWSSFAVVAQVGEVLPAGGDLQRGSNWGLGLGADYEWARLRLGATVFFGGGGTWGSLAMRGDLAWLFFGGTWSPYVGMGAGVMLIGRKKPDSNPEEHLAPGYLNLTPLLSFQTGVELMRDREIRLLLGGQLDLPWSNPFRCNATFTSCDQVWTVRYPVVSLATRVVF
jgi:hypothetical protein